MKFKTIKVKKRTLFKKTRQYNKQIFNKKNVSTIGQDRSKL